VSTKHRTAHVGSNFPISAYVDRGTEVAYNCHNNVALAPAKSDASVRSHTVTISVFLNLDVRLGLDL
jgi:hypothetical protein